MARKPSTTDEVDAALARWRTKLKRAFGMVEKLEKQRKRIEKKPPPPTMIAIAAPQNPKPYVPGQSMAAKVDDALHPDTSDIPETGEAFFKTAKVVVPDGLDIPDWLKRAGPIGHKTPADLKALEEIAADKERRAKAKRDSKTLVKPSKKLGVDAKKMPLSGKAALDMIKNG